MTFGVIRLCIVFVFFFKQKTAYEMRISDWSSDVCSSDLTISSPGLPKGHVDAGEQLAHAKGKATGQSCVDCHGEEGNAPIDASYPKLGGQYHDYLAHSLQEYRNGNREHALMSQQAKDLTDQQIADLAAYFGSRPSHLRDLHGVNN